LNFLGLNLNKEIAMKNFMLIGVLAAFSSVAALGAEVTAEKKAPGFDSLIKPTSANVQYRHFYDVRVNNQDFSAVIPSAQVRSNLGFSLLNGALDTTLILGATKETGTQAVTQRRPQIWTETSVLDGENLSIAAYLDMRTPMGASPTNIELGLNPNYSKTIAETKAGTFSMAISGYFDAIMSSQAKDATFTNSDVDGTAKQLGLVAVGEDGKKKIQGAQKDPSYDGDVELMLQYKPTTVSSKLTVGVGTEWNRHWDPKYELNAQDVVETSFEASTTMMTRLSVSYKASDKMSVSNNTWHNYRGMYVAPVNDATTVFNMTTLSYSIF
jgi:hypothetical protein